MGPAPNKRKSARRRKSSVWRKKEKNERRRKRRKKRSERRKKLARRPQLPTLTILELTDFVKRPRNCGKNCTATKKRNTTTNKESVARNTIEINYVKVSTNTWANSTRTRIR